ncbi:MAG: hypothetical protein EPN62_06690 [Candidimonas sp.]|nr:MAG: hypothetical protein EPN77_10500 [Candidimonas sp.]TAM24466.1 MAG: hypothetical protein EPN62_06690 [Candidimonas sp.]
MYTSLRGESVDHQRLPTIVEVRADGTKEQVALADGIQESKASWLERLQELKARGLATGPLILPPTHQWTARLTSDVLLGASA